MCLAVCENLFKAALRIFSPNRILSPKCLWLAFQNILPPASCLLQFNALLRAGAQLSLWDRVHFLKPCVLSSSCLFHQLSWPRCMAKPLPHLWEFLSSHYSMFIHLLSQLLPNILVHSLGLILQSTKHFSPKGCRFTARTVPCRVMCVCE